MSRVSERDGATGDGSPGEDLAAILHDDEFVESILRGGEVPTSSEGEADLAVLFSGARHEIISAPMPGMPSDEDLAAALEAGAADAGNVVPLRRRRHRWMTTAAAGAASVAVLLGGIAVAGHFSGADAPAGQSSEQYVTAASVRDDLARAQDLLAKGDKAGCLALLDATTEKMEKLRGNAAFDELDNTRVELWAKATGLPKSQAPAVGEEAQPAPQPPSDTSTPAPPAPPAPPQGGINLPQVPGLPSIELPPLPQELIPQIPLPQPQQQPAPTQQQAGTATPTPTATATPTPTRSTPSPTATDEPSKEMLKQQEATPTKSSGKQLSDLDAN